MKVICIDATSTNKYGDKPLELKEGNIYTKIREHVSEISGKLNYELEETDLCYGAFRFIHLSEIDETTFERSYQKETA